MIITKTPLRISFFGGGTDYPTWVKKYGGAVLSTTINKYLYINIRRLPPFFPYKTRIVWSIIEDVNGVDEIKHPSVRETLAYLGFHDGISLHYNGDLPARSGLGSSSSFTVGLLHALYGLKKTPVDKLRLATEAIHIEQNCIKENVGYQDQIASAFGGFNKIEFHKKGGFSVTPIKISPKRLQALEKYMMLFFTGFSRTASEIVGEQIQNIPNSVEDLHAMRELVNEALSLLESDDNRLDRFGELLDKGWKLKRKLSSKITNDTIDALYEKAKTAGALGGKLLGAGGGGFFLIFAKPEDQENVRDALKEFLCIPFNFESQGSQIIYQNE